MKTYVIIAVLASLSFACERKDVTITPPADTKEETTIVTPAPSSTTEKKTETETRTAPDGTTTRKTETTEEK